MVEHEKDQTEQHEQGGLDFDPSGPVSIEMVRAAIRQLEEAGQAATRRAVRLMLGKGSLRTIHSLMSEIETVKELQLDRMDITDEDRRVIVDFGARMVGLIRWRLEQVTKAREGELLKEVEEHRQRAVEVIELAEVEVTDAKIAAAEAAEHQAKAEQARVAAEAESARQTKEAERSAGQVSLLLEEREEMRRRLENTDERLTRALAAQEAEAEEVARLEKRLAEQKSEIDNMRAGREEMLRSLGEKDAAIATLKREGEIQAAAVLEASSKLVAEANGHLATKADLAQSREKIVQLSEKAAAAEAAIAELQSTMQSERLRADAERARAEKAEQAIAETRGSDGAVDAIKRMLEAIQSQDSDRPKSHSRAAKKPGEAQGEKQKG